MPARLITDFVGSLPPAPVDLSVGVRSREVHLACARNESTINAMDAEDFPRIANLRPDKSPDEIDTVATVETKYRRMVGDLRDKEGVVLGVAHVAIGAAMLFFFWKTLSMAALPEWAARTVAVVLQISSFAAKTIFWCWVFIWVRWSLPRFRYDQLMRLGWKQMIPLSFVNIFLTGLVILWMGR